jgi:hypothetical protein
VEERREGALQPTSRGAEVEQVEAPARDQDAPHVGEGRALLVACQVMEHERGEHAVEARVGGGDGVAEALEPVDREAQALGLRARAGERLRVGVERHEGDAGMPLRDRERERARAAAEVEHALARLERRDGEQSRAGAPGADQPAEGVVEREQEVASRGGDEVAVRLAHAVSFERRWRWRWWTPGSEGGRARARVCPPDAP